MSDQKINKQNPFNEEMTPELARELLWRRGILDFKLDLNQIEMRRIYRESQGKIIVWACSRRLGKTWTLCVVAIEQCLKKKNCLVKYLAPQQKMVRQIIRPIMRQLIADCPEDIRPIEKTADGLWYFPSTGSQIQMAGCDNGRAESVRGSNADLCIIDEAGFVNNELEYIINSILLPTTATTKGKILLASTPPKSPTHDFVFFMNLARSENSFVRKTIYDNPRLTKQDIDLLIRAAGGVDSVTFKREYLAHVITDDESAVVPEFNEELKKKIIKPWVKPAFFDTYVAMDVGMKDLTVVLFAYYDYKAGKLIIEDEFVINGQKLTTQALAEGVRHKESTHFSNPFTGEPNEPYMRVSDNNLILINDLWRLHGLLFYPTKKDDADAALNNMRILLKDEKIIINPRCVALIRHLEGATWNKNKTSYTRSGDDGHFDGVDSLKYLIRNVNWQKSPFPNGYGLPNQKDYYYNKQPGHKQQEIFKKIMNIKKN